MLSFDAAVARFSAGLGPMAGALGSIPDPHHIARARAQYLGRELAGYSRGIFRPTYVSAVGELASTSAQMMADLANMPSDEAPAEEREAFWAEWARKREVTNHLSVAEQLVALHRSDGPVDLTYIAFKGFSFSVRAYQDGVYAALLTTLRPGAAVGQRSSMKDAFGKGENPVGSNLREDFPEYEPWFDDWRQIRNDLKLGVPMGARLESGELTLQVGRFIPEGGGTDLRQSKEVSMADIVRALDMSSQLSEVTKRVAEAAAASAVEA
jgi:hypothetical protein